MPLKMKNAHCCRKRDHKGPPCVIESEIGKGRHMEVGTAIPPEKLREANRVPEVAGAGLLILWASRLTDTCARRKYVPATPALTSPS
jgi:hypothetical protein